MTTRLLLAALAIATLLPSASIMMSTDAEAYSPGRYWGYAWRYRWLDKVPTHSAGAAALNCGLGWHMGGDGKCYIN